MTTLCTAASRPRRTTRPPRDAHCRGPDGPHAITFGNGQSAVLCTESGCDPRQLLSQLELTAHSEGRPVVVVCGSADQLAGDALRRTAAVAGPAVVTAAGLVGAAVVDGGTDAGVMAIMGEIRQHRGSALPVLLGVAPGGKVALPHSPLGDRTALEPHHSHFVLADSDEWGGETGLLLSMVTALAGCRPVVMVLAGGGEGAEEEVLAAVRKGWPVFIVEGTGGLADRIAAYWRAARAQGRRPPGRGVLGRITRRPPLVPPSPRLAEIATGGDVRLFTGDDPHLLTRQLAWELQEETVLKAAWRTFATYDHLASRLQANYQRFQASILILGVLATLFALLEYEIGGCGLHWVVVVIPITVSMLIAWSSRRADGQRWIMLRAAAEAVKAEIYRYRTRTLGYSPGRAARSASAARQTRMLEVHLDEIDAGLVRTEASSGPLTRYDGPLPLELKGAGRHDDGLSPLDAVGYITIRIEDQIAYYHDRINHLHRLRAVLELLAISAGGAGAILAASGSDIWIGLTSGVSTAALAYLGYLRVENSIIAYNRTAGNLASQERAWRTLGPKERTYAALGDLVSGTEAVLRREHSGWVHQMSEALQDLKSRQEKRVENEVGPDDEEVPVTPAVSRSAGATS